MMASLPNEHKRVILDFYILMYKDDIEAEIITSEILSDMQAGKLSLREWIDNALTYPNLTRELRNRLKNALRL